MTEVKEFAFVFNQDCAQTFQEKFKVEVWCDGRQYQPDTEAYHPVYSYRITDETEVWEYTSNDIVGAANEVPDLNSAAKSLFAFLIACQEGLPEDTEGKSENADTFPPHVREFAYLMKEQIEMQYQLLTMEEN